MGLYLTHTVSQAKTSNYGVNTLDLLSLWQYFIFWKALKGALKYKDIVC